MTELPPKLGLQPVLEAIDQLQSELASYDTEGPEFEAVRNYLKGVLTAVKQTLMNVCNQYNDGDDTYLAFKMEGVVE